MGIPSYFKPSWSKLGSLSSLLSNQSRHAGLDPASSRSECRAKDCVCFGKVDDALASRVDYRTLFHTLVLSLLRSIYSAGVRVTFFTPKESNQR